MKAQEVIMIGAGGHALSLAEFSAERIIGYISPEENDEMPGQWLGDDETGISLIKEGDKFHMAFIYSGWPRMQARRALISRYLEKGARFITLVSPNAIITKSSRIGEGSAVLAGAIVNRAKLEANVVVNSGAIVEHDCIIGENTFIGPGAVIGGFTHIGRDCFIGLGARIGNGLTIGDNITVAMGAVVNKDLTEPGIYHGCPVRHFKFKD
ncbi:MAG: hypothetical protein J1F12_01440 [Muribaculaceae bacterium]|nr:hypothetical protein [Muribaculaceae bacterium]